MKVDEAVRAAGLDITETEHAGLLYACQHGASAEQSIAVLSQIGKELTTLSQATLAAAEVFFRWGRFDRATPCSGSEAPCF